jgi:hypothetical protein
MGKVYIITPEQLAAWKGKYGVHAFDAIEDADGNLICGLNNADNPNFPFVEDLKKCNQIEYVQKVISRL